MREKIGWRKFNRFCEEVEVSERNRDIRNFCLAVKGNKFFRITREGDYYITKNPVWRWLAYLGFDSDRWIKASKFLRSALQKIESIPINFNLEGFESVQLEDFTLITEAAERVLDQLKSMKTKNGNEEEVLLHRELIALLYRLEECNKGLSPREGSEDQFKDLVEAARFWISSQVVFENRSLSSTHMNFLHAACRYGAFVKLLLSSQHLLDRFFEWVLRDYLPFQVFIEYPSIQQKINDFHLNGRISHMGCALLKIQKIQASNEPEGVLQKIVTLPFEGRDVSILDDERLVVFEGNYALTVAEVFEEFAKKNYGESNLEFMRQGFINWNAFRWGRWDAERCDFRLVDLNNQEWWKELPVYEELTLREARKKFGTHLNGTVWGLAAIATRQRANLDFEGAHAYSSIAIPIGLGRYAVYAFGKYSTKFPQDLVRALLNIGHTSEATIAYPDENVFYTHRQRSMYSFALSESQGLAYLNAVKEDMLIARAGNFIYQIESENCAKWAHQKIEAIVGPHRIPNVFQMPFLRSEPHGFMENVFAALKLLPELWQVRLTLCIHFFLGGYKGLWIWEAGKLAWKSLYHHSFWKDTVIYHPSMLHRQQELGIIGRYVRQGVTFTKHHIHSSYHDLHHKMVIFSEYIGKVSETWSFLGFLRRLTFFYRRADIFFAMSIQGKKSLMKQIEAAQYQKLKTSANACMEACAQNSFSSLNFG